MAAPAAGGWVEEEEEEEEGGRSAAACALEMSMASGRPADMPLPLSGLWEGFLCGVGLCWVWVWVGDWTDGWVIGWVVCCAVGL